ncbi:MULTISPECIES: MarR family winged helix-turn-helix transcriptional regulator [unclassified Streptomyces]|uniref:MarR family winged helix-turn-helix transcriptional regulator n=1 Tax=unclassified Streptomyces TaxID=2593676 RepID=UPI0003787063|nr:MULTISPECIES: MarR family transcriptional regulator [unclassified Streptomyces]MYQ75834.1 MarR family transcriptional regulator [Streptomyces sp. SID4923]
MSTKKESAPDGNWLTPDEERDWRAYLRMVTAVQGRTARDLAALGLSEPDYEVLSTLSERTDGTSTLHEQATKMGWSRSRLSRHASRMEARDLIRRAPDPADGRGCLLALTPTGRQTLREAAPHHVASVRRHFVGRLTPEELTALGHIARKLSKDQ